MTGGFVVGGAVVLGSVVGGSDVRGSVVGGVVVGGTVVGGKVVVAESECDARGFGFFGLDDDPAMPAMTKMTTPRAVQNHHRR